jgi:3-phosphoshikimate 1-carboxyvinyltransferase
MIKVIASSGPVRGRIRVPGSKSLANRALICAALARGTSRITDASDSDDTALLINGLNQLGVLVRREGTELAVEGTGGNVFAPKFPIAVGNAGTTTRFLIALACLASGVTVIEGSERMGERPVEDLLDGLRALGANIEATPGHALFRVRGGALKGGTVRIRGDKSSQFLSAILMAAPRAESRVVIEIDIRRVDP